MGAELKELFVDEGRISTFPSHVELIWRRRKCFDSSAKYSLCKRSFNLVNISSVLFVMVIISVWQETTKRVETTCVTKVCCELCDSFLEGDQFH